MPMSKRVGYNERLFSGDAVRRYYHEARFKWADETIAGLFKRKSRFVEIGCFDGRLFDRIAPLASEYVGIDANWERGLDLARQKYAGRSDVILIQSGSPDSLAGFADRHFDCAISLETIEHMPPEIVELYLDQLARVTRGHVLISVPNELGLPFLAKYLGKAILYEGNQDYSFGEVIAATLGRSDRVARNEHKGFDYRRLVDSLSRRFDILAVEGLPALGLPPALSPTIGIVAAIRS
jgi:SAM-dependent methyltransferase